MLCNWRIQLTKAVCFVLFYPLCYTSQLRSVLQRNIRIRLRPRLVLLVDDEVDLSTTLRIGLQRKGYDVLIARDGQEAVRLLEE